MTPELTTKIIESIEQVNKNLLMVNEELSGHIKKVYGHLDSLAEIVTVQQKEIAELRRQLDNMAGQVYEP